MSNYELIVIGLHNAPLEELEKYKGNHKFKPIPHKNGIEAYNIEVLK